MCYFAGKPPTPICLILCSNICYPDDTFFLCSQAPHYGMFYFHAVMSATLMTRFILCSYILHPDMFPYLCCNACFTLCCIVWYPDNMFHSVQVILALTRFTLLTWHVSFCLVEPDTLMCYSVHLSLTPWWQV